MVAVDASILVRIVAQDIPGEAKLARDIVTNAAPASLLLDRLILAELNYVLKSLYGYERKDIITILRGFMGDTKFRVVNSELVDQLVDLYEVEKSLSFEDCWLLAQKRASKVTDIITLDKQLLKRLYWHNNTILIPFQYYD